MDKIITTIWDGWQVTGTAIYSPEGQQFFPSDLRARMYDKALIAEYQKLERLRRKAVEVKIFTSNIINFAVAREKIMPKRQNRT